MDSFHRKLPLRMLDESDGRNSNRLLSAWRSHDVEVLSRTFQLHVRSEKRSSRGVFKKKSKHLRMNFNQFQQVFGHALSHIPAYAVRNAFDIFDEDGSGKLDFREFCVGVAMCSLGDRKDKAGFVFDIFSRNKDHHLDEGELSQLFLTAHAVNSCFSSNQECKGTSTEEAATPPLVRKSIAALVRHLLKTSPGVEAEAYGGGDKNRRGKGPLLDRGDFVSWAAPNFDVALLLRPFQIIVPAAEEKDRITALLRTHLAHCNHREGTPTDDGTTPASSQAMHLVSKLWWDKWCAYTQFDATAAKRTAVAKVDPLAESSAATDRGLLQDGASNAGSDSLTLLPHDSKPDDSASELYSLPVQTTRLRSLSIGYYDRPGAIDNGPIEHTSATRRRTNLVLQVNGASEARLRPGLQIEKDFVGIPPCVWDQLWLWYGGGPTINTAIIPFSSSTYSLLRKWASTPVFEMLTETDESKGGRSGSEAESTAVSCLRGELLAAAGYCASIDGVSIAQVTSMEFTVRAVSPATGKILMDSPAVTVYCDAEESLMSVIFLKMCKTFRVFPALARLLLQSEPSINSDDAPHATEFVVLPDKFYRPRLSGRPSASVLETCVECPQLRTGALLALEVVAAVPRSPLYPKASETCVTGGICHLPVGLEVQVAYSQESTEVKPDRVRSEDSTAPVYHHSVELLEGTISAWSPATATYTISVPVRTMDGPGTTQVRGVTYPAIRGIVDKRNYRVHDALQQHPVTSDADAKTETNEAFASGTLKWPRDLLRHGVSQVGSGLLQSGIGLYEQVDVLIPNSKAIPSTETGDGVESGMWKRGTIVSASKWPRHEAADAGTDTLVELRVNFGCFRTPQSSLQDLRVVVRASDPFSETPVMGESTPTDSDDNPSALNGAVIFTRLVAPKTNRATADGSDRDEHTAAQLPSPAASPLVLFPNLMQPKFRKLFLDVKSDALVLQKPVDEPRHSDSSGDMHGDRFECGSTCLSRETLTFGTVAGIGELPRVFKGTPPQLGAVGLANLGNTCYMNTVLQCLSNTTLLRSYFLRSKFLADLNRANKLGTGGKLSTAFGKLIHCLWYKRSNQDAASKPSHAQNDSDSSSPSGSPRPKSYQLTAGTVEPSNFVALVPSQFRELVGQLWHQFSGKSQQDAHEFFSNVLDGLHEDLNHIPKKAARPPSIDDDGKMSDDALAQTVWKSHLQRNRSVIVQLFHGLLKSEINCKACGACSRKFEPFSYLSLPVNQPNIKVQFKFFAARAVEPNDPNTHTGNGLERTAGPTSVQATTSVIEVEHDDASVDGKKCGVEHRPQRLGIESEAPSPKMLFVELTTESLIGEFVKKCEAKCGPLQPDHRLTVLVSPAVSDRVRGLKFGSNPNLLDPTLWRGAEQPWPANTLPVILRSADAYVRAAGVLAGKTVHVFETPMPKDVLRAERRSKLARGANSHASSDVQMDRDGIPSASYEAYVEAARLRNEKMCCRIWCEEFIMSKAEYYHSAKYIKARNAQKRAEEKLERTKREDHYRKQRLRMKESSKAVGVTPSSSSTWINASIDKLLRSIEGQTGSSRRERIMAWLQDDLHLWYRTGTRVFCTDSYGSTYQATVTDVRIKEVEADASSVDLMKQQSSAKDVSVSIPADDAVQSPVVAGNLSTSSPSTPKSKSQTQRVPNVLVAVDVHFDNFRLQYEETIMKTSNELLAQMEATHASRYARPESFHSQIKRAPRNASRKDDVPTSRIVRVMHHSVLGLEIGDEASKDAEPVANLVRASEDSFGTPFVVAISTHATFAEAYATVVKEASRFVNWTLWRRDNTHHTFVDVHAQDYPFQVALADDGSGSHRNLQQNYDLPFIVPSDHIGRISLNYIDNTKYSEKFVVLWSDRRYYNKAMDQPPPQVGNSECTEDVDGAQSSKARRSIGVANADPMSIRGSLNRLVEPEKLPDDYKCDTCKEAGTCARQMTLWSLPDFLVIQIKRFQYTSFVQEKIRSFVKFDLQNFDLSPWVSDEIDEENSNPDNRCIYDLYAVVNHQGGLSSGHYTNFALNTAAKECGQSSSGEWFFFNDDDVRPVAPRRVVSAEAYILFYQRRSLSPKNLINTLV